jgi:hypothetical protein
LITSAFATIVIKTDRDAVLAFGACGRPFANGGPPLGVHLDGAGRLIELALRNASPGELAHAAEAVEIDVARGALQPRKVTCPEEAAAAKAVFDSWRLDTHDARVELFDQLQRAEQARAMAHYQAEHALADRARKGEHIEGRDSIWHASVRAIRSAVGADFRL